MDVWVYKNIGYVPIVKNASSTFTQLFAGMGWEPTQLDLVDKDLEIFGHFSDPIDRHFRGTAEFLYQNQLSHLVEDIDWQKIWVKAVMDMHSYPVTWAMGNRVQRCHWIPMHEKLDTDLLTRKYLARHGVDVVNIPRVNESNDIKKRLYHRLKELHTQLDAHNHLSFFYDSDIILWNSLFPYVDADHQWHTIY